MGKIPTPLSRLPNPEVIDDTWEFKAGDYVPGWLAFTTGLKSLKFTKRTTIFCDLDGTFWIVPHTPTEQMMHGTVYTEQHNPGPPGFVGHGLSDPMFCPHAPVDLSEFGGHLFVTPVEPDEEEEA